VRTYVLSILKRGARTLITTPISTAFGGRVLETIALYAARRWPTFKAVRWYVFHVGAALAASAQGDADRVARYQDGIALWVNLRETYARHLYFYGIHEDAVLGIFQAFVRPGMVIFDIGANLGYYTCLSAKLVGPKGAVHAFEPDSITFRRLKRSVEHNNLIPPVHLNQCAVYEESGKMLTLYTSGSNADRGVSSIIYEWKYFQNTSEVVSKSVDDYVLQNSIEDIDLVKIDIEGAEMLALRGMTEMLSRNPPKAIVMELTSGGLSSPHDIIGFLVQFGYRAFIISDAMLKSVTTSSTIEYDNAIFIQPQHLATVAAHYNIISEA